MMSQNATTNEELDASIDYGNQLIALGLASKEKAKNIWDNRNKNTIIS
jgi:hypothetical protein